MKETSTLVSHRPVSLRYLSAEGVDAYLQQQGERVACVVGFGSHPLKTTDLGYPVMWVDMPVYGRESVYEVWTAESSLKQYKDGLITGAFNGEVFFGCMSVPLDGDEELSEASQRAFSGIFEFLQRSGHPNLIRVWNYFPWINAIENDLERYRSFSVGRHEAFVKCNRSVEDSPAACALGSYGGPLVIYFMAAREQGVQIENPRQISAYSYPQQYGPRSPTFSRATLAFKGDPQVLFISGTASIIGHETVHPHSVSMQTRETLENIRAVIDQAVNKGFSRVDPAKDLALKVYVRHQDDFVVVAGIIREELGEIAEMVVLQADICRTDLLVEIEAVCWNGTR